MFINGVAHSTSVGLHWGQNKIDCVRRAGSSLGLGGGGANIPGGSPSRGSDVTSKNVWKGGGEEKSASPPPPIGGDSREQSHRKLGVLGI